MALALSTPLVSAVVRAEDTEKERAKKPSAAAVAARDRIREFTGEEGPIEARELYWESRRQGPTPGFSSADARLQAITEKTRGKHVSALAMGTAWTPIGPQPINGGQTPQNGANRSSCSGRTNAIAIDGHISPAPATLPVYVGAAQGGVWKSTDNGATWTPLTDTLGSLATGSSSIAIDPTAHAASAATIYLGTGEGNFSGDSYSGVGVYKSTDSGATWAGPLGNTQFHGRSVATIAIDRSNTSMLLAGSSSGICGVGGAACGAGLPLRGIYKSTDSGLTWAQMPPPAGMSTDTRVSNIVQDPLVAARWYAGTAATAATSGGLWLSTDSGSTWAAVAGGLPALAIPAQGINRYWVTAGAAAGDVNSTLYVGTGNNNASTARGGRVYKSTDSGATWTQLAAANDFCMGQCWYDTPVYTQPDNPAFVYTGGAGAVATGGTTVSNARFSSNGGTSFADIMVSGDASTAIHSDTHNFVSDPVTPTTVWAVSDGGVWRSADRGTNWADVNGGLNTVQFTGVDLHPTNPNIVFGGTQDNGTNTWGGGLGWSHADDGDGGFAVIDQTTPTNAAHTYYNSSGSIIAAAVDTTNGPNATPAGWPAFVGACSAAACGSAITNGINLADRVLFYAPIVLDRGATDTFYFGTNHLYRSDGFFAAAIAATATTTIFTELGTGGNQDLTAGGGAISAIETFAAQAPAHGGTHAAIIYTGSSDGRVFRSIDSGASFTQVDAPGAFVGDIAVDPTNSQIVYSAIARYAGSAGQNVRKSIDGGTTWNPAATGIPDIPVNSIVVDPTDHTHVWAGTDIGVYYSSNSGGSWAAYGTGLPNVAVFKLRAQGIPAGSPAGQIIASTHGRGMWKLAGLTPVQLKRFDAE